jgi:hypothetical protein
MAELMFLGFSMNGIASDMPPFCMVGPRATAAAAARASGTSDPAAQHAFPLLRFYAAVSAGASTSALPERSLPCTTTHMRRRQAGNKTALRCA